MHCNRIRELLRRVVAYKENLRAHSMRDYMVLCAALRVAMHPNHTQRPLQVAKERLSCTWSFLLLMWRMMKLMIMALCGGNRLPRRRRPVQRP